MSSPVTLAPLSAVSPEQRLLVQISLDQVRSTTHGAASLFYERLYQLEPSLRPESVEEIERKQREFMTNLANVVEALDTPEAMAAGIEGLRWVYAAAGVQDRHHASVGAALMWSLERSVGATFTPEVRSAWVHVYGVVSSMLLAAPGD